MIDPVSVVSGSRHPFNLRSIVWHPGDEMYGSSRKLVRSIKEIGLLGYRAPYYPIRAGHVC